MLDRRADFGNKDDILSVQSYSRPDLPLSTVRVLELLEEPHECPKPTGKATKGTIDWRH